MKDEFKVDEAGNGRRVDLLLGERLSLSRARLKSLFDDGLVRVNGRKVRKGTPVIKGDRVEFEVPDNVTDDGVLADPAFKLSTLFTDEYLVFVDKPAGVPSQPLKPGELGTVANGLVARFPEMADVGADVREAGLVHRLDIDTSGVLLAARTPQTWEKLRDAFGQERSVEKKYLALVKGPLADEGTIDVPLEHAGDHVVPSTDKGRPAITEFQVRARRGAYALVDVTLITGVLHQVRAHLASVGAPIVGDTLYGGPEEPELGRFFLHAVSLKVTHPVTGKPLFVESPLPDDLGQVLYRYLPGPKPVEE